MYKSLCNVCARSKFGEGCEAFPNQDVPSEVFYRIIDHRYENAEGDNGLMFVPTERYREEDFPPLTEEDKKFFKETIEGDWILD